MGKIVRTDANGVKLPKGAATRGWSGDGRCKLHVGLPNGEEL